MHHLFSAATFALDKRGCAFRRQLNAAPKIVLQVRGSKDDVLILAKAVAVGDTSSIVWASAESWAARAAISVCVVLCRRRARGVLRHKVWVPVTRILR